MARSRRKNGGPRRDVFKKKKLGKGYSANRKVPVGSRIVLRITEPVEAKAKG
jgi:ribosomal protein L39E